MEIRFKDFIIGLIPIKKIRQELKHKYGTYPYCSISQKTKITIKVKNFCHSTKLTTSKTFLSEKIVGLEQEVLFMPE